MAIEFTTSLAGPVQAQADMLVLPCFADPGGVIGGPGVAEAGRALGIDVIETLGGLAGREYRGRTGEAFESLTLGRLAARRVLLLGLGAEQTAGPAAIRDAVMIAARQLGAASSLAVMLPAGPDPDADLSPLRGAASALAEGLVLGSYRYGRRPAALASVTVLTDAARRPAVEAGLGRGALIGRLTNWVRDLVTTPAAEAGPAELAEQARRLATDCGLGCSVLGASELTRGGFGGILGVGQGSVREPRLVELSYRGAGDGPVIALTGKGITFDSGGLSLKINSEIEWMKSDMAGAAAVMAVLRGAAELGLPVNLDAALPFAENMPGGSAQRPGDVLTHRGGRTTEVVDTDSEGRLVLADTLAYLAERRPAVLIDVATLTDAAGLGGGLFAAMGSDQALLDGLLAAASDAGDPGWQLPLPEVYRRYLHSPVADGRNTAKGVPDTTVLTGLFLRPFTAGLPWAHIDNGSTAYLEEPTDCWPEGATGSPTRAILRWLETGHGRRAPE